MTEKKTSSSRSGKTTKSKTTTVSSKTRKETPVKTRPTATRTRTAPSPLAAAAPAVAMAANLPIGGEELMRMIAELAYFRAEKRGFQGGDPVEDWLMAEQEIKSRFVA